VASLVFSGCARWRAQHFGPAVRMTTGQPHLTAGGAATAWFQTGFVGVVDSR
jgi:hypothetical protein